MSNDPLASEKSPTSPGSNLTTQAEDPNAGVNQTLKEILNVLQKSTIVNRDSTDTHLRFWNVYKKEADEFDEEFLNNHGGDLDVSLLFSGLLLSVCGSAVFSQLGDLQPANPDAGPNNGPSTLVVWVQSLLYASMASTLFTSLVAMLGKQWLNQYRKVSIRGTIDDRGKDRQRKLDSLKTWGFGNLLGSLSFFLQLALFLFSAGLSTLLWSRQQIIGGIFLVSTAAAGVLYLAFTVASLVFEDCPFQTPLTNIIRFVGASLLSAGSTISQSFTDIRSRFIKAHSSLSPRRWSWSNIVSIVVPFACAIPLAFGRSLRAALRALVSVIGTLTRIGPHESGDPRSSRAAYWMMLASDDPSVQTVTGEYMLDVNWPSRFDVLPVLDRLLDTFLACFPQDTSRYLYPAAVNYDRALALGKAFLFLYWHGRFNDPHRIQKWREHGSARGQLWVIGNRLPEIRHLDRHGKRSKDDKLLFDELLFICQTISLTFRSHSEEKFLLRPGWMPLSPSSQSLLVAHSRISYYMLKDSRMDQSVMDFIFSDLLLLGPGAQITPQALESHSLALMQGMRMVGSHQVKIASGLVSEHLGKLRNALTTVSPHSASNSLNSLSTEQLSLAPFTRDASRSSTFIAYCLEVDQSLREEVAGDDTARWCLPVCESISKRYLALDSSRAPMTALLWATSLFRLSLSTLCEGGSDRCKDPLGGPAAMMLSGAVTLPDSGREILAPHFPSLIKYARALLHAISEDTKHTDRVPFWPTDLTERPSKNSTETPTRGTTEPSIDSPTERRHLYNELTSALWILGEIFDSAVGSATHPDVLGRYTEVLDCLRNFRALDDSTYRDMALVVGRRLLSWIARSKDQEQIARAVTDLLPMLLWRLRKASSRCCEAYIHLLDTLDFLIEENQLLADPDPRPDLLVSDCRFALGQPHPEGMWGHNTLLSAYCNAARLFLQHRGSVWLRDPPSREDLIAICIAWRPVPGVRVRITLEAANLTLLALGRLDNVVAARQECCIRSAVWTDEQIDEAIQDDETLRQPYFDVREALRGKLNPVSQVTDPLSTSKSEIVEDEGYHRSGRSGEDLEAGIREIK